MAHRVARSRWDASLPRSATRRRPMPPKAARGPMTAALALALVLLVLVPAPLAAQDVPAGAPAGSSSDDPMCDLYIAPSSTSEEGGPPKMGIYAGRTFAASERVGPADIAVQLLDVDGHTGRNLPDYAAPQLGEGDGATALNPFGAAAAMMWTSDSVGGAYDSSEAMGGGGQTFAAIPGVGMLANYHSAAVNANWNENGTLLRTLMEDQAGGMGVAHPGRGAVSEYYNVTVVATQAIPVGMEIFINFGDDWSHNAVQEDPDLATGTEYDRADEAIDRILAFFRKYEGEASLTAELRESMYAFLRSDVVNLDADTEEKANQVRSLFPETAAGLQPYKDAGGSLRHKNPEIFRDTEWLRRHGSCIGHLRAGSSTIDHAGRGAFATRAVGRGDVVAPAPLVHIGDRAELDMYALEALTDPTSGETRRVRQGSEEGTDTTKVSQQLYLNYCFGHMESTVLLCPFGPAVNFINHGGPDANAKVVWSVAAGDLHNATWLQADPRVLSDPEHSYAGLMFDIVATRAIGEEEEVTIDYGVGWQTAWDAHVKKVKEVKKDLGPWMPTALELNDIHHRHMPGTGFATPFKTSKEAQIESYPERVMTTCFAQSEEPSESSVEALLDGEKIYNWSQKEGTVWRGVSIRRCDILERKEMQDGENGCEKNYNYTVRVHLEMRSDEMSGTRVIQSVPHLAIRFADRPYQSDQSQGPFQPFRHYMEIPDTILPDAWRNIKSPPEKDV